ncbi:MAG: competence/damage-inducible protein A [Methylococcales bacterium]|nr:competence/damage-inducible protein A [Methylococcales bacterium]
MNVPINHPVAEIFSQGEEVITGQVTDTNAAWLSQRLVEMGFVISRHTAVGDKLLDLISLLTEISQRADFCICSGGLGPTIDDLTTEAVSLAFDRPLQLDPVALEQIEQYFLGRNRVMAESNRKQAYFPEGAIRLDNAWGTAPGFAIQHKRCWFVFVPGVPTEMRHMFNEQIKDDLFKRFVLQSDKLYTLQTVGIGESELQQKINTFTLPDNVQLSFRATAEQVQTKLLFPSAMTEVLINSCVTELSVMIGDAVFAIDKPNQHPTDLIAVIDQLMQKNIWTLSVFETISQGLIAAKCIGQEWLQSTQYIKTIGEWNTEQQGDLSDIAQSIAQQIKAKQATDLLLLQLYQGTQQQFQDKQQSIVIYNVLITPQGMYQNTTTVAGPIKRKQNQSAIRALDLLRRVLQNCAINTIK